MGQFSNPVATHPRTNEVEVPPPELPPANSEICSKVSYDLLGAIAAFAAICNKNYICNTILKGEKRLKQMLRG